MYRSPQQSAFHGVIIATVFKLLADTPTDSQSVCRAHRYIARVEKGMKILSQEQSIFEAMRAKLRKRSDVCGVQHGKRSLAGDRATTLVGVEHLHTEGALPEPRVDENRRTVAILCDSMSCLIQAQSVQG